MKTEDRYYKSTEKELVEFCDDYFANDSEVEKYCKVNHIPTGSHGISFAKGSSHYNAKVLKCNGENPMLS